jgi:hypothetical protein
MSGQRTRQLSQSLQIPQLKQRFASCRAEASVVPSITSEKPLVRSLAGAVGTLIRGAEPK